MYLDIFTKIGFKIDNIDIIYLPDDKRVFIKYEPNSYYDVNLFINIIMPEYNHYKSSFGKSSTKKSNIDIDYSYFKIIFPAGKHIFSPNVNSFIYYMIIFFFLI